MLSRHHIELVFSVVIACIHTSFAQVPSDIQRYRSDLYGSSSQPLEATLSGNRIRTLVYNDGQIGKWNFQPSLAWYESSPVSYLAGHTLLVAAEITAPGNGAIIHPVETSFREYYDYDPIAGGQWGFAPLPGYHRATRFPPTIAASWDTTTWPSAWPPALGLGSSGNGIWYSHGNAARGLGTREIMFIMDDSRDKEWTRSPYSFYPVLSDSARGGLGLRVEARIFQWADSIARDMMFMHYDIWNLSDVDYALASIGLLSDPSINPQEPGDDCAVYDSVRRMVYVYDSDGVTLPDQRKTGYLGYVFLTLPGSDGSPSTASPGGVTFLPYSSTQWRPSNDEAVWQAMASGRVDGSLMSTDVVLILSGGTFPFPKWTKVSFAVAFVFADSLDQLFERGELARAIASDGYKIPETTSTHVDLGVSGDLMPERFSIEVFPNPFNPTTTIRYNLSHASRVTLEVYNLLGQHVAELLDGHQAAGVHDVRLNSAGLPSGMYLCRIQVDGISRSTKLVLSR